jgi:hypothetical protein
MYREALVYARTVFLRPYWGAKPLTNSVRLIWLEPASHVARSRTVVGSVLRVLQIRRERAVMAGW